MNSKYWKIMNRDRSGQELSYAGENIGIDERIADIISCFLEESGDPGGSIPELLELLELFERLEEQYG